MMIDFPTKAWKKIDDAKKIISAFKQLLLVGFNAPPSYI